MGFIYLFIYLLVFREHILPPFWVNSVIFVYQYQRLFSGKCRSGGESSLKMSQSSVFLLMVGGQIESAEVCENIMCIVM